MRWVALMLVMCAGFAEAAELKVMSFNLRYAAATGQNNWPSRRPITKETIDAVKPDLIGTQEGLYAQLKDIAADQPDYEWIGLGREGGSRGEFMAIFYRKARFEPLAYDHFWLSDTPDVVGSSTWGNQVKRMVTWVRFKDKETGREFLFWNTHFDHRVQEAREKSAELVRKRVEALKTDLPVILAGDFNAEAKKNKAYTILTEGEFFADSYTGEEAGTFHDFTGTAKENLGRIDWILLRGGVKSLGCEIIRHNKDGKYPSDHFPIVARLEMP